MKKCSRCTKPATLHITEIQEGEVQELHLCENCAQQYLAAPEPMQSTAENLEEKFPEEEQDEHENLICPNCEISFKEFRSQGRLGCAHDYVAFLEELTPLLENIHGETQHVGKYPKRAPDASRRQYELIRLRNDLRTAVDDEAYEKAADLRDLIQKLEDEIATTTDD